MPCCQNPPDPVDEFHASLEHDSQLFARYVANLLGNGEPIPVGLYPDRLISALHLEMKLWLANSENLDLPTRYHPNDAMYNAWWAMRNRTTAGPRFAEDAIQGLFANLHGLGVPQQDCVQREYDEWILNTIEDLKAAGLVNANLANQWLPPDREAKPPELGTVGLAQKLVGIYTKYEFCWQVAGKHDGDNEPDYPVADRVLPHLRSYQCALHAPLDGVVIKALSGLPIGRRLRELGFLRAAKIVQSSDGQERPWSKLDCLRSYYGLQLVLRRIAMATWPPGCACSDSDSGISASAEWFNRKYPRSSDENGKDWIEMAASDGLKSAIDQTVEKLSLGYTKGSAPKKTTRVGSKKKVSAKGKRSHESSNPEQQAIWISDIASDTGEPHQSALRILHEDNQGRRNLGWISNASGCLNLKAGQVYGRYPIGEIGIYPYGNPAQDCTFVTDPRHHAANGGAVDIGGGVGYEGWLDFDLADDELADDPHQAAVGYLKQFFDVLACTGNHGHGQAWIDAC